MSDASPVSQYRSVSLSVWFVFAAILLSPIVVLMYFSEGHPVSMRRLEEVQLGMDEAQVRDILGEPPSTEKFDAGGLLWTYHGWHWYVVRVRFAPDGTVAEVDHDH